MSETPQIDKAIEQIKHESNRLEAGISTFRIQIAKNQRMITKLQAVKQDIENDDTPYE